MLPLLLLARLQNGWHRLQASRHADNDPARFTLRACTCVYACSCTAVGSNDGSGMTLIIGTIGVTLHGGIRVQSPEARS
jgi:hypothetical protein